MNMRTWDFTDGKELPIGTMYCIGKNYADHAKEMGGEVPPSPIVFIKPPSAYMPNNAVLQLPSFSNNVHHEVELVVVLGADCANITAEEATNVIAGYGLGIDLTLRDLQTKAKERGEPWSIAKAFRGSAPISAIIPADEFPAGHVFSLALSVNGNIRQQGTTAAMERDIATLVAFCSSVFDLRAGDCIFTGTPAGVAAVQSGDKLIGTLDGKEVLHLSIA